MTIFDITEHKRAEEALQQQAEALTLANAELVAGHAERQQTDNSMTRRYGGTCLGLTLSRSLCQLLGYQLTVHSEVDKGSTFSVIFTPV